MAASIILLLAAVQWTSASQAANGQVAGAPESEAVVGALPFPVLADDPAAEVRDHSGQRAPGQPTSFVPMAQPISLDMRDAFVEGVNVHDFGPVAAEEQAAADATLAQAAGRVEPLRRLGVIRAVGPAPLIVDDFLSQRQVLDDGRTLWALAIRSPGARAIRLHFTGFNAGAASVLVYTNDAQWGMVSRGPFTGKGPERDGDFWTATLPGDTAYVEIVGDELPQLSISDVFHWEVDPDSGECKGGQPGSCHLNAMCFPINPVVRDAVGAIRVVTACSGTVLNDLDDETVVPYFLTADHCGITSQSLVDMMEIVWFWQSNSCDDADLPAFFALPRSVGGTLIVTTGQSDATFIRLHSVPAGVGMVGWTTQTSAGRFGVHHPCGSFKRATFFSPVGFCPFDCACKDPTDFDYYDINSNGGWTEGGSSGSGIFTNSGLLAGQLFGKCCACGAPENCSHVDDFTYVYGEFQRTYDFVRVWLEIGGTVNVSSTYNGVEEGTPAHPFRTIAGGYNLAWNGARIRIKGGSYPPPITMSKKVTLLATLGTVRIGG